MLLKPDDQAPNFELSDQNNKKVSLSAFLVQNQPPRHRAGGFEGAGKLIRREKRIK